MKDALHKYDKSIRQNCDIRCNGEKIVNPFDEFYQLNHPFWANTKDSEKNEGKGRILVFLNESFRKPNYVIDTMLFAKKLQEATGASIVGVYYGEALGLNVKKILKSFEVSKIVHILKYNIVYGFFKVLPHIPSAFSCKDGDGLLKLNLNSIPIGECIYDTILRSEVCLTIDKLTIKHKIYILEYMFYFFMFSRLIKKLHASYFIYADCDYLKNAFIHSCKKLGIKIYELNRFGAVAHQETGYKRVPSLKITYSRYNNFISSPDYKKFTEDVFQKHFSGKSEYPGFSVAYNNKRAYSKTDLIHMYGLSDDRPCILVASHALSDSPHGGNFDMVFRDYYDWLVQTLIILSKNSQYNVFVKEHPESNKYGEQGSVEGMLSKKKLKGIYLIPEDCDTRCLYDFMDCVITCCGTIGIEASCFGIPVITAAKGYYYGFGLDYNFSDYQSYENQLRNISQLKKRPEITEKAKDILAIMSFCTYSRKKTSIFPSDSFYNENNSLNDYERISLINERMKNNCPKDDYYDTQLDNIVVLDDNDYPTNLSNNQNCLPEGL